MAIASLILSITGFFTVGFTAILGVIFGHLSRSAIKKSDGKLKGSGLALAGTITGYAMVTVQVALIAFIVSSVNSIRESRAEPLNPSLIEAPNLQGILDTAVQFSIDEVDILQTKISGTGPGQNMQFRVYLPAGSHNADPASLACVLVAPAGTNLLSGADLDELDEYTYHDETIPYAKAGMVTILYSIDGSEEDYDIATEKSEDEELRETTRTYNEFRNAQAGIVNSRNALELALSELPMVDPNRVFSAGHSSAGTLSLLFAAHENRLAGSIAYAPCVDVEVFQRELIDTPFIGFWLPDLKNFLKKSSPINNVEGISHPLFLFQSQEDETTPFSEFERYIGAIQRAPTPPTVTKRVIPEGGHYYPMIQQGIPTAIEWIKAKDGE